MAISDYITSNKDKFAYQYNGNDYLMCATFVALDDSGKAVMMKGNAFRYIEIIDNIYHPFHTAEIIVKNDLNFFDKEYTYLGNGRDMVILTILPDSKYNAVPPLTNDDFVLKFEFIITDCVDINYENSICKRLKLVEAKEYKLSETFFNIVGVQKSLGGFSYLNTNEGNAKPTGLWIKSILKDVCSEMGDDLFIKDADGKEFFEQDGSINIDITPHGAIPNISILNYIMQFHIHNESPCILRYDRIQKKFYLISYKTLFENNEIFCKNELQFGRIATHEELDQIQSNVVYDHFSKIWTDLVLLGQGGNDSKIIESYIEQPDASLILKFFAKESVTSYSRSHGAFMYNAQTLTPDFIIQKYKKCFVDPFKTLFKNYDLKENFTLPQNTGHMTNAWKTVTDSLPPEMNEKQFEIKKLNNLLNLNNTYIYKCRGSTSRKAATFIDVVKFDKNLDNDKNYDLNHLGRHLITCVKHIFIENNYFNKIETIKPYKLLDAKPNKPIETITNLLKKS
jgi:hypothetical protein